MNQAKKFQKEGGVGQEKTQGRPKTRKIIQFPPRWTRAWARQMEEEQQAHQDVQMYGQIEELIKTSNIKVLIKMDQQKWGLPWLVLKSMVQKYLFIAISFYLFIAILCLVWIRNKNPKAAYLHHFWIFFQFYCKKSF